MSGQRPLLSNCFTFPIIFLLGLEQPCIGLPQAGNSNLSCSQSVKPQSKSWNKVFSALQRLHTCHFNQS